MLFQFEILVGALSFKLIRLFVKLFVFYKIVCLFCSQFIKIGITMQQKSLAKD